MARDLDSVRVVVAAPRDRTHGWPTLKSKADRCSTTGAELYDDLLLAGVGDVLVLAQCSRIKLQSVDLKDGLCVEGGARDTLAEGAVASEGSNRRSVRLEPHLSAETATFKRSHGDHPGFVNG